MLQSARRIRTREAAVLPTDAGLPLFLQTVQLFPPLFLQSIAAGYASVSAGCASIYGDNGSVYGGSADEYGGAGPVRQRDRRPAPVEAHQGAVCLHVTAACECWLPERYCSARIIISEITEAGVRKLVIERWCFGTRRQGR